MGDKTAEDKSTVTVHYTGTLDDGTKFDSTEGKEPLTFQLGAGQIIPGFEKAITGLKEGDETKVTIPPAQAYGPHHDQLVQEVPKDKLPPDVELKPGVLLNLKSPTGQSAMVKITEVKENKVVIDLNHPLAGKTLHFTIKLIKIASISI